MTRDEVIKKYGNKKVHEIGDTVFIPGLPRNVIEAPIKARTWTPDEGGMRICNFILLQDNEARATKPWAVFDNVEDALTFRREYKKAIEEARDA